MKTEAQRIAIAEACGFVRTWHGRRAKGKDYMRGAKRSGDRLGEVLPNYLSDLNACHAFEKTMDDATIDRYIAHLSKLSHPSSPVDCGAAFYMWHASAPMRCQAFLKTLSLWKD